ncbi:MAG: hypothetical protein GC192_17215 [Bacteroidetes bacterium]|nr:hypothetical protein [Bacteroidota bacterium]
MKSITIFSLFVLAAAFDGCSSNEISTSKKEETMEMTIKQKAVAVIESIGTGAQEPVGYINAQNYTQHNLAVGDGLAGFGAVMANAPAGGFKSEVVRAFQDGEYAFLHVKYDFFGPKAAFDIFRFKDGKIVEHWDNLAEIAAPNPSGHTQFDGATEITDLDKTESNKTLVKNFVNDVLMGGKSDKITDYISTEKYVQHNPQVADGLNGLGAALKYFADNNLVMQYDKVHKVLGEGNFVLTVSEGQFGIGDHVAYYDLFRVENGKIVEHWDVIQTIPPKSEWKNANGKF